MHNDDEAWRAIVENYGDRAEIEDRDPGSEPEALTPPPTPSPSRSWEESGIDSDWSQDRFVPPPPPPVPRTTKDRSLAWFGVFGAPGILLVCLLLGIELPSFVATLLVVWFVGGFLYLVLLMPRGPRDPGDDGAVL